MRTKPPTPTPAPLANRPSSVSTGDQELKRIFSANQETPGLLLSCEVRKARVRSADGCDAGVTNHAACFMETRPGASPQGAPGAVLAEGVGGGTQPGHGRELRVESLRAAGLEPIAAQHGHCQSSRRRPRPIGPAADVLQARCGTVPGIRARCHATPEGRFSGCETANALRALSLPLMNASLQNRRAVCWSWISVCCSSRLAAKRNERIPMAPQLRVSANLVACSAAWRCRRPDQDAPAERTAMSAARVLRARA